MLRLQYLCEVYPDLLLIYWNIHLYSSLLKVAVARFGQVLYVLISFNNKT
jgi:hypothetical protein